MEKVDSFEEVKKIFNQKEIMVEILSNLDAKFDHKKEELMKKLIQSSKNCLSFVNNTNGLSRTQEEQEERIQFLKEVLRKKQNQLKKIENISCLNIDDSEFTIKDDAEDDNVMDIDEEWE